MTFLVPHVSQVETASFEVKTEEENKEFLAEQKEFILKAIKNRYLIIDVSANNFKALGHYFVLRIWRKSIGPTQLLDAQGGPANNEMSIFIVGESLAE